MLSIIPPSWYIHCPPGVILCCYIVIHSSGLPAASSTSALSLWFTSFPTMPCDKPQRQVISLLLSAVHDVCVCAECDSIVSKYFLSTKSENNTLDSKHIRSSGCIAFRSTEATVRGYDFFPCNKLVITSSRAQIPALPLSPPHHTLQPKWKTRAFSLSSLSLFTPYSHSLTSSFSLLLVVWL